MEKSELVKRIRKHKTDDPMRMPCFICGRWQSITHCHHIASVSSLADWCMQNDFHYSWLPIAFVWLCPNHHEWLHRYNDKRNDETRSKELLLDLTREEQAAYKKLLRMEDLVAIELTKRLALVIDIEDFGEKCKVMSDYVDNEYVPKKIT